MLILVNAMSLLVSRIIFGKFQYTIFLYIFNISTIVQLLNLLKIRILLFAVTSAVLISFYANSKSENLFDWIYNDGERIVALIYFVLVFFFQHVLFYLGKFIFIALKNFLNKKAS